jgi:hypothetical protein
MAQKPPANFNEYMASVKRTRSTIETEAALQQQGEDVEDSGLQRLRAGTGVLALIGLEILLMTFGYISPALLRASDTLVATLDDSPTYSGLFLRTLPGGLRVASWAGRYLAILLWLLSFAEAALFMSSKLSSMGKTAKFWTYVEALAERPLHLIDIGLMVLNGIVVFTVATNSGAFCFVLPPHFFWYLLPLFTGRREACIVAMHTAAAEF